MNTSDTSVLTHWRVDATLWIEINRPDALNAVNLEVMDLLLQTLHIARDDHSIRAVVLKGAGNKCFISGGDLKEFAPLQSEEDARMMSLKMQEVLNLMEALPCWTIACINGDAYGGGCETMLAMDFRFSSKNANLGFTQTRFVLPCGWGGMTRLVETVGRAKALHWLATSRVVPAQEAMDAGLVHQLFEPEALVEEVQQQCNVLTQHPRHLILALKQAAQKAWTLPRDQAIQEELAHFAACWAHDDHLHAVDKFLSRKR